VQPTVDPVCPTPAHDHGSNKLKAAIDTYNDVWEEKRVKVGPIWVTKKIRKQKLAGVHQH
jgi:hypothetical protein